MTALKTILGVFCSLCVAAAAETGNISAKPSTASETANPRAFSEQPTVAKQSSSTIAAKPAWTARSFKSKAVDQALTRHTSSFNGPPGPTLAVGARFVRTPSPGLKISWLDNFGEISEGEYIYDWPPGARLVTAAPPSTAVAPVQSAVRR